MKLGLRCRLHIARAPDKLRRVLASDTHYAGVAWAPLPRPACGPDSQEAAKWPLVWAHGPRSQHVLVGSMPDKRTTPARHRAKHPDYQRVQERNVKHGCAGTM